MPKITCISDTHMRHEELTLTPGDILVHAGDVLKYSRNFRRTCDEFLSFLDWLGEQPFQHKILIGGNHDLLLASEEYAVPMQEEMSQRGIVYLQNTGAKVGGLTFYGVPQTDLNMAFSAKGAELERVYAQIPQDVDVLITHAAPRGILDEVRGQRVGCEYLLRRMKEVRPKVHIFGHIHEGYGLKKAMVQGQPVVFINCALDASGELNKPIQIKI